MARSREAYVDTSAFIAFMDASDSHHSLFVRLFADPPPLCTSSLVIAEGHGWFLRRFDRGRALGFLSMIALLTPLRVIAVGGTEIEAAAALMQRFRDQNLTLADAVGLHVMKVRRSAICWSIDHHLRLTGVPLASDGA